MVAAGGGGAEGEAEGAAEGLEAVADEAGLFHGDLQGGMSASRNTAQAGLLSSDSIAHRSR